MTTEHLVISQVSIEFATAKGPFKVLEDVNLGIAQGEFVTLIGHSGCGKSTVLNIVAGLHKATLGGVILDGREVDEPGPDRAVVFQNHSLLPWLSAYQNVELAVKRAFKGKKSRKERDEWIKHNLNLVHMGHAMHKRPGELSGGMKQRVGIARALAMEPKVLLMDEPFGALDALTRAHMQDSLMEIHARLNNTVIMITHDVDEAVLLSDRIVMMTNGPAAKVGEILAVDLLRPRNRLTLAEDPRYNHYRAEVVKYLHERHSRSGAADSPAERQSSASHSHNEVLHMSDWRQKRAHHPRKRLEKSSLALGFIPLTDCAPLVVAKEKGYFEKHGLDVELSRESSWANIRDKVSIGMLDGAQMVAGMPLASIAGHDHQAALVTAMSLDLNGNGITLSNALYAQMAALDSVSLETPVGSAKALKAVIERRKKAGGKPFTFAMVFPTSMHNYLLRYWMASAGIDPDRDVRLTVVPPPQMVNYLRAGLISGFCVGEPWNAHAVNADLGHTITTSYEIWNNHPEKVFAVTRAWADANPNTHQSVLMALLEACAWIDRPESRLEVCELIGRGRYVNAPLDVLRMSMTGTFQFSIKSKPVERPDFNVFHRYAANYPWRSHAAWILTQMQRWGQVAQSVDIEFVARMAYRPDIYRKAAEALEIAVPALESKREGEHTESWTMTHDGQSLLLGADRFMDGRAYDPDDPEGYLNGFDIKHTSFNASETSVKDVLDGTAN